MSWDERDDTLVYTGRWQESENIFVAIYTIKNKMSTFEVCFATDLIFKQLYPVYLLTP